MFNDNTIIQSIHNQNYTEAIKKIRLCFKETIESEDIIHSFIIGLLGLKANNCYEYMLQLTKFNSYCSNETNKYSFSMNHTLFSFIKEAYKDNNMVLTILKYYNKENQKSFHLLYMIYLIIGIVQCDNNEIEKILKRTILKEKCMKCFICQNVQNIIHNNLKMLKEKTKEIIKPKISIINNCTSARLLLTECYFVDKVKSNKTVFTYQEYINNTISKNKKTTTDVNQTFDISKYSTDTVNIVSSYIKDKEIDEKELTKIIENHLYNISKRIQLLDNTFDAFELYNKGIKDQMKSIIDKYNYK